MLVRILDCKELCLRVEDPVLNAAVSLVGRILSLGPVDLDLLGKALRVILGTLLGLLALGGEVVGEALGVPAAVWCNDLVVPVVCYRLLEVLTVRGSWVGNAVV